MKTKRTRIRGKRRTSGGRKATSKKSASRKFWINNPAVLKALDDAHWKIDITISSEDRIRLLGLAVVPKPPKPPITYNRIADFVSRALRR